MTTHASCVLRVCEYYWVKNTTKKLNPRQLLSLSSTKYDSYEARNFLQYAQIIISPHSGEHVVTQSILE